MKGRDAFVHYIRHSQGAHGGDHTVKPVRAGQLWLSDQQRHYETDEQYL